MKNSNRGAIPGLPKLDKLDDWSKLNQNDTKITFNPLKFNMLYDEVPKYFFNPQFVHTLAIQHIHYRNSVNTLVDILVGFKILQVVYMARWFNFYYEAFDRSGRSVDCDAWNDRLCQGKIGDIYDHEHKVWIGYKIHWLPKGDLDVKGSNSFMIGGTSIDWIDPTYYTKNAIKRVIIPGYQSITVRDSDLPSTVIRSHPIMCVHCDNPATTSNDMENNDNVSYFNTWFGKYGFYAWPVWLFWKGVSNNSNYSTRIADPLLSTNFLGLPPEERFRG
jgi:hypothetical protein